MSNFFSNTTTHELLDLLIQNESIHDMEELAKLFNEKRNRDMESIKYMVKQLIEFGLIDKNLKTTDIAKSIKLISNNKEKPSEQILKLTLMVFEYLTKKGLLIKQSFKIFVENPNLTNSVLSNLIFEQAKKDGIFLHSRPDKNSKIPSMKNFLKYVGVFYDENSIRITPIGENIYHFYYSKETAPIKSEVIYDPPIKVESKKILLNNFPNENLKIDYEEIELFSNALKEDVDSFYDFYYKNIRNNMPEHKFLKVDYDNSFDAYAIFFGSMMDQMGVSGKITWTSINNIRQKDREIFNPKVLLEKYPEKKKCNQRNKQKSDCQAKNFLDDFNLSFYLGHAHTMFNAAHYFNEMIKKKEIISILDLPKIRRYTNASSLYLDMRNNIFSQSSLYPKTLGLAFRLLTENKYGRPEGEERFWNYPSESLMGIPMPVDFWIVFFTLKTGLLFSGNNNLIINTSDPKIKEIVRNVWSIIGRNSNIPPIFLDPSIWKIAGDDCIIGNCDSCLFTNVFGYDCPKKENIKSISKKTVDNRKIYSIFYTDNEAKIPSGYRIEPKGRKN